MIFRYQFARARRYQIHLVLFIRFIRYLVAFSFAHSYIVSCKVYLGGKIKGAALSSRTAPLTAVLNCYDEIKELVEKIYNEGPIPGSFDEIGYDASRWGEDEELINYTGYIIDGASSFHERLKIYVKYMEGGFHR